MEPKTTESVAAQGLAIEKVVITMLIDDEDDDEEYKRRVHPQFNTYEVVRSRKAALARTIRMMVQDYNGDMPRSDRECIDIVWEAADGRYISFSSVGRQAGQGKAPAGRDPFADAIEEAMLAAGDHLGT